jgi:hypothetical protein
MTRARLVSGSRGVGRTRRRRMLNLNCPTASLNLSFTFFDADKGSRTDQRACRTANNLLDDFGDGASTTVVCGSSKGISMPQSRVLDLDLELRMAPGGRRVFFGRSMAKVCGHTVSNSDEERAVQSRSSLNSLCLSFLHNQLASPDLIHAPSTPRRRKLGLLDVLAIILHVFESPLATSELVRSR